MRPDMVPGAVFPDYNLSDHRGMRRTLSQLQEADPLVLVLSRGGFCPKERRQHEGLVQLHREMQVGHCRLVTISTDNLIETNEFRSGVGADWVFLSDAGRKLQKDLDIQEYTDPDHNPMIPHTLVLEPGLRIYKIYTGTGSSAARPWRSCASTCAQSFSVAVPTGTSAAWNSGPHGRKGTRRASIRTGRPRRRYLPIRIDQRRRRLENPAAW